MQPLLKNDLIAQLVEHIPFKDGVLGSSPSWITRYKKRHTKFDDLVAQLVEHIPFKDGVLGSNPSWITQVKAFRNNRKAFLLPMRTKKSPTNKIVCGTFG